MSRHLLAGVVLVFLSGTALANQPPVNSQTTVADAKPAAVAQTSPSADANAGNKPTAIARSNKADEHKLNKLKVYPCF